MPSSLPRCATGLVVALLWGAPAARADLVFSTAAGEFDPGTKNQGYYNTFEDRVAGNDNYIVGRVQSSTLYHNFFTFDLSALDPGTAIGSATLRLTRFSSYPFGTPSQQTYQLWDVSTDAETLNTTLAKNAEIFNDLGSGVSYGTFVVDTTGSPNDTLTFTLNADALEAIRNSAGGFFSIGGSLDLSGKGSEDQALFVGSGGGGIQQLVITEAAVPEPSSVALSAAVGAAGVAACYARRRSSAARRPAAR